MCCPRLLKRARWATQRNLHSRVGRRGCSCASTSSRVASCLHGPAKASHLHALCAGGVEGLGLLHPEMFTLPSSPAGPSVCGRRCMRPNVRLALALNAAVHERPSTPGEHVCTGVHARSIALLQSQRSSSARRIHKGPFQKGAGATSAGVDRERDVFLILDV